MLQRREYITWPRLDCYCSLRALKLKQSDVRLSNRYYDNTLYGLGFNVYVIDKVSCCPKYE